MSHLHDKVSGLVDGELGGNARSRALNHLRRCEACRAEVRATLQVKRRLEGLAAAEPPVDLLFALGTFTDPTATSEAAAATDPIDDGRHPGRRVLAGAATMSVALLGVAYVVGAPEEPGPAATVTPPVEQFVAEFAGSSGTPLGDPAVGAIEADDSPLTLLAVGQVAVPIVAATTAGRTRGDESGAVATLRRASDAAQNVAFSGERRVTIFDGVGPSIVSVRVEHIPGQGTSFEMAGVDDDAAAFIAGHAARADAGEGLLELLVGKYDLGVTGRGWVADRPSTVVTASIGGVLAARFWIDDATGLLLRRDLYDDGGLVRSSQFTSLRVAERSFASHLPPVPGAPSGTSLSMKFAPSLNDQGWSCPEELIGGYELTNLEQLHGDVVHATYGDGLSTVAIYEQRGHLDPRNLHGFITQEMGGQPLYVRQGLPTVAVWESSGTIYSVVSDAPDEATERVIAHLPHSAGAEPGTVDRVTTGLRKIGSLANPVD